MILTGQRIVHTLQCIHVVSRSLTKLSARFSGQKKPGRRPSIDKINEAMNILLDKPTSSTFRAAIQKCENSEDIVSTICEYRKAVDDGQLLTYREAIKKLIAMNGTEKNIDDVWKQMTDHILNINATDYTFVLNTLKPCTKYCCKYFSAILNSGIDPNCQLLTVVLQSLDINNEYDDWKKAITVWCLCTEDFDVRLDAHAYTTYIQILLKHGRTEKAQKICDEALSNNDIELSRELCSSIFSVCNKFGNVQKMVEIAQLMNEKGIEIDTQITNISMDTVLRRNEAENALKLWELSKKWNLGTVRLAANAYILMIQNESDQTIREKYLNVIRSEMPKYFKQFKDGEYYLGILRFDAEIKTYRERYDSCQFKYILDKYKDFKLWKKEFVAIPVLSLVRFNKEQAEYVIRYIFEQQINTFRKNGLDIEYFHREHKDAVKYKLRQSKYFNPCSKQVVIDIFERFELKGKWISLHLTEKDGSILHLSTDEIKKVIDH
eukprot:282776_1